MGIDANLLNFWFRAIFVIFVSIQLAGRMLKKKSIDFNEFFKVLTLEVNNRGIKSNKYSLQVKNNRKNSLLNSLCTNLKQNSTLKTYVSLTWFYRKNFDKILEKLKEKHSDKRFISIDVKLSSNSFSAKTLFGQRNSKQIYYIRKIGI